MARLDDKHLVVCEHLGEPVGKDLTQLDVNLVHLQLLLVTLNTSILIAAGIFSRLQLMFTSMKNTEKTKGTKMRKTANKERDQISVYLS